MQHNTDNKSQWLATQLQKYRHSKVAKSVTIAGSIFAALFLVIQALGFTGGFKTFCWLSGLTTVVFVTALIYFLARENRHLKSPEVLPELLAIHNSEEDFANRLDFDNRAQFLLITKAYKDHIHQLQQQLQKLPTVGAVEASTVIEGGEYVIGCEKPLKDELPRRHVSVNAFRIDLSPVTNKQFGDFIADPENEEWLSEAIYRRYDIPYCLCEFVGNSYPSDKWDHPVVWVNWYMAAAYCNWRSRIDNREGIYTFVSDTNVAQLRQLICS